MSRPLHAVLTELLNDEAARQAYTADPAGLLDGAGYAGLPDELVAEAVISFADTASPAVAEHLAPFVMTHGPVAETAESGETTGAAGMDGLALLAGAPMGEDAGSGKTELLDPTVTTDPAALHEPRATVDDLDFGTGSGLDSTAADAGAAHDALPEIPTAETETATQEEPVDDDTSLPRDPALGVDETGQAEDHDTE